MPQPATVYPEDSTSTLAPEAQIESQDLAFAEPPSDLAPSAEQLGEEHIQNDGGEPFQSSEGENSLFALLNGTKDPTHVALRPRWRRIGSIKEILRPGRTTSQPKRDSGISLGSLSPIPEGPRSPNPLNSKGDLKYGVSIFMSACLNKTNAN